MDKSDMTELITLLAKADIKFGVTPHPIGGVHLLIKTEEGFLSIIKNAASSYAYEIWSFSGDSSFEDCEREYEAAAMFELIQSALKGSE